MLVSSCKYLIVVLRATVTAATAVVVAAYVFFLLHFRTCTFFAPSRRNWIRVFVASFSIHRTRVCMCVSFESIRVRAKAKAIIIRKMSVEGMADAISFLGQQTKPCEVFT